MDILTGQLALATLIENFETNTLKAGRANFNAGFLRGRRECLDNYWRKFQENHRMLLAEEDILQDVYFREDRFSAIELTYTRALGMLYEEEAKLSQRHEDRNVGRIGADAPQVRGHLPKIALPTFNGRQGEWEPFRDLFRSLIHEDGALTGVQKLYYLKTSLQGEARAAIEAIKTTEGNYVAAWDLLLSRYDNKLLLASQHMNALAELAPPKSESSNGVQELLDQVRRHRQALESLGKPVADWGDWFVFFATRGMDPTTRRDWERQQGKGATQASYEVMVDFLQDAARTLRTLEQSGNASRSLEGRGRRGSDLRPPTKVYTLAAQTLRCRACGDQHHIGRCKAFDRMTAPERKDLVTRSQLCFNCLRTGHVARSCPSGARCQKCGRSHHTSLHEANLTERRAGPSETAEPRNAKRPRTQSTGESEATEVMPN